MNRETVQRLNRINAAFYRNSASEFSNTRSRPWGGWRRILELCADRPSISALDVGCGNARFASELATRFDSARYLGLDASHELLTLASERLDTLPEVDGQVDEIDLVEELPSERLSSERFDLVVAFGLFHHLPGFESRGRLLGDLASLLAPGGLLAIGFWQFGAHERFRKRIVDWQSLPETTGELDLSQLEERDHLLAWGEGGNSVRYCHWVDPTEIDRMLATTGLCATETYDADGGLNRYVLIRASPSV